MSFPRAMPPPAIPASHWPTSGGQWPGAQPDPAHLGSGPGGGRNCPDHRRDGRHADRRCRHRLRSGGNDDLGQLPERHRALRGSGGKAGQLGRDRRQPARGRAAHPAVVHPRPGRRDARQAGLRGGDPGAALRLGRARASSRIVVTAGWARRPPSSAGTGRRSTSPRKSSPTPGGRCARTRRYRFFTMSASTPTARRRSSAMVPGSRAPGTLGRPGTVAIHGERDAGPVCRGIARPQLLGTQQPGRRTADRGHPGRTRHRLSPRLLSSRQPLAGIFIPSAFPSRPQQRSMVRHQRNGPGHKELTFGAEVWGTSCLTR